MEYRISGAAVRHVILHYQLVGNAGHLIERILDKNFADSLIQLNGESRSGVLDNGSLLRFLRKNPEAKAISSHHLRPPKPQLNSFVFFDVLLLRHPLDRIYAMFEAQRSRGHSVRDPGELAEADDLRGFVKRLMTDCPHLINNSQVNYLARAGRYFRPPDRSDLQKAMLMIREAALPGLTSLLDISLATGEYYMRPAFGNLDLSYVNPNPSSMAEGWRSRVDALKEECGDSTYKHLAEMNKLDFELLEFTEAEIRRRFELMPFHEERWAEFLERCRCSAEFFLEHDTVDV